MIWNDYLDETQDFAGASLMPLFLSCRAAVRAKTSATAANLERDPSRNAELQAGAQQYLRLAVELLRPSAACLVGTGGLSGSGKSTLAAALAPLLGPAPGAVVIRSDAVRKRLCGVVPTTRLGPEGYSPGVSEAVYETLAERAELVTRAGHAAIADAVYASVTDRIAIERRADEAATCFVGLWLEAPTEMLVERATGRGPDPSDADAAVVEAQGRRDLGEMRWERIDATSGPNEVLKAAMAVVGSRTGTAVRVTASGGADG